MNDEVHMKDIRIWPFWFGVGWMPGVLVFGASCDPWRGQVQLYFWMQNGLPCVGLEAVGPPQ